MSLTKTVAALVIEMESATVDTVLPHMPGYTRAQVSRALKAARERGLIESDGRQLPRGFGPKPVSHRATGGPKGSPPTTYRAIRKQSRPAASVWHFAQLQAA